ncbi:MAG: hypothetical protein M1834_008978 [Cirrosporium novae-zelandiae]|nr:MAG: hypothetical protein M1834_008978 [Cirrosporium novae-zelandiae]
MDYDNYPFFLDGTETYLGDQDRALQALPYLETTVAGSERILLSPTFRTPGPITRTPLHKVSQPSMDLSILSAESYQEGVPQPRQQTKNNQMYLGIVREDSSSTSQSTTEQGQKAPNSRKRAKRGEKGNEEEPKKPKGRPRVAAKDESAAERRRTQIRLAQRAYRMRKESTITTLKQRVSDLEKTIEEMNQSFLQFNDTLFGSSAINNQPDLARQLHTTTEHFLQLARIVESDSESDYIQEGEKEDDQVMTAPKEKNAKKPASSNTQSKPQHAADEAMPDISPSNNLPPRASSSEGEIQPETSNIYPSSDEHQMQIFHAQLPELTIAPSPSLTTKTLSSPYTYSFQETTFSRRLFRTCYERGFQVLSDPRADPAEIRRLFRLTFTYATRSQVLEVIKRGLMKSTSEPLDNWDAPFYTLGGAGLHYPVRDKNGNPTYPANMISPYRLIGHYISSTPESPLEGYEKGIQDPDLMLYLTGLDGEWFDAHDVEEYLKERGIYLDGSTTFVELPLSPVPMLSSPDDSPRETVETNPPKTPSDGDANPTDPIFTATQIQSRAQLDCLTFPIAKPKISPPQLELYFRPPPSDSIDFTDISFDNMGRRTSKLLDVEKMITAMVGRSICLGRSPGFRREDVDAAINHAIF